MVASTSIGLYRKLMIYIAHELKVEDLMDMKYMCRDILSVGKLETVTTPLDLIQRLEEVDELGKEKLETLVELLQEAGRNDLKQKVAEYQGMADVRLNVFGDIKATAFLYA